MSTVSFVHSDDRRKNVKQAFSLVLSEVLGELKAARTVLIKPNLVHHLKQLASTHVDAVRGVLDVVRAQTDAKVIVGEASYHGTKAAFRHFGYDHLLREYENVELLDLNDDETVEGWYVKRDGSKGKMQVSKTAMGADFTINLANIKTHCDTGMSLGMKNWTIGTWVVEAQYGSEGKYWPRHAYLHDHGLWAQHKTIAGLYGQHKPSVSILDGFYGMEGEGPSHGSLVEMQVAFASTDVVSLDAVACRFVGIHPEDIGYLVFASEKGMGEMNEGEIQILGEDLVSDYQRSFVLPHGWEEHVMTWK